ncbi:hypothetical protein OG21DRAFT_225691 [Imleria badia]|nr:hypothetical protein OG21DRAFT_225691 [Imleria badia]
MDRNQIGDYSMLAMHLCDQNERRPGMGQALVDATVRPNRCQGQNPRLGTARPVPSGLVVGEQVVRNTSPDHHYNTKNCRMDIAQRWSSGAVPPSLGTRGTLSTRGSLQSWRLASLHSHCLSTRQCRSPRSSVDGSDTAGKSTGPLRGKDSCRG